MTIRFTNEATRHISRSVELIKSSNPDDLEKAIDFVADMRDYHGSSE